MKKLLSVLLVSISLMGWSQERVLFEELSYKGDNYYFESKLFNGIMFNNYDNGQLRYETNYKNGTKDGEHKEWYTNGQLEEVGNYKNDEKEGDFKWYYENGQISKEKIYKNGKQVGKETEYYKNGQKSYYEYFNRKDGKLIDGVVYSWYENGQKQFVMEFRNDREDNWIIKFDENGQIIEKTKYEDY